MICSLKVSMKRKTCIKEKYSKTYNKILKSNKNKFRLLKFKQKRTKIFLILQNKQKKTQIRKICKEKKNLQ